MFWCPSTNKNAFAGTVGSSTILQVTQKESFPPVHRVIGRQTSVLALDTELALVHEPAPATLDLSPRSWFGQSLKDKWAFVEDQVSGREYPALH